jgi:tetratricopeptide (TPR) repeat protein
VNARRAERGRGSADAPRRGSADAPRRDPGSLPGTATPLPVRELAVVAVVALAARVLYLLAVRDEVLFQAVVGDSQVYVERARALLAGRREAAYAFTPPLYPLFLAAVFGVAGERLELVRWLQAAGGVVGALAVTCATAWWFERRAALMAGLVVALSPVVLFFEGELLSAAPVLLGVTVAIASAAWGRRRQRPLAFALAGGAIAAAALGQPNVLLLAPALLAWAAWRRHAVAWTLAAAIVVLLAGSAVQYAASGHWVGISANGGVNLYIGNHRRALGGFELPPGSGLVNSAAGLYPASRAVAVEALAATDPVRARALEHAGGPGPMAVSAYWARRALSEMAADPRGAVRRVLRKLLVAVHHDEIPNHYDLGFFKRYSPLLAWNPIRFWWLFALGALGIGLAWRRRHPAAGGLALGTTLYLLGLALFFVTSRYRLPLWPLFAIGAAHAGVELWHRRRSPRRLLAPLAVGIALTLVSLLPPSLPFSPAHTEGILAAELERRGQHEAARAVLAEAARHADLPEVSVNLANRLFHEGSYEAAGAEYGRALELQPDLVPALVGLGASALRLGRPAQAVGPLSRAVTLAPQDRHARLQLGIALRRAGRPSEAASTLAALSDADATAVELFEYGLALIHLGQRQAAREAFARAAELDPEHVGARINVALIDEERGELEQARASLRALAGPAPDSIERLLALGRIEARLGHLDAARSYLARVGELAPGDPRLGTARALVERLEARQTGAVGQGQR